MNNSECKCLVLMPLITLLSAFVCAAIGTVCIEAIAKSYHYENPANSTTLGLFLAGLIIGIAGGLFLMRRQQSFAVLSWLLSLACVVTLFLAGTHISSHFDQLCIALISCLCTLAILLAYGIAMQESGKNNRISDSMFFFLVIGVGVMCGFIASHILPYSVVPFLCLGLLAIATFIIMFLQLSLNKNVARL